MKFTVDGTTRQKLKQCLGIYLCDDDRCPRPTLKTPVYVITAQGTDIYASRKNSQWLGQMAQRLADNGCKDIRIEKRILVQD